MSTIRPRLVCSECQDALAHKLITLHAAEDTVIVCEGNWNALPQWCRDSFTNARGKGLEKRREAVGEIREQLTNG